MSGYIIKRAGAADSYYGGPDGTAANRPQFVQRALAKVYETVGGAQAELRIITRYTGTARFDIICAEEDRK